MKTAKQWAVKFMRSKMDWCELVKQIQIEALERASDICVEQSEKQILGTSADVATTNCSLLIREQAFFLKHGKT